MMINGFDKNWTTTNGNVPLNNNEVERYISVRPSENQLRLADRPFYCFIHFGMNTATGREWGAGIETVKDFTIKNIDAAQWVRVIKSSGATGIILTCKHHDGFCLWNSEYTDFCVKNTDFKGDIVKLVSDECHKQGMDFGVYLSPWDMHDKRYGTKEYDDYFISQIGELLTNYGKIDILWFDFAYGELRGEAWKATKLMQMVRSHQPDVIVDNRLEASGEGFGSLVTEHPAYYSGDFVSPEQLLPPEGIRNVCGERVPWELCATMNNNWGYVPYDTNYKPASMLIRKLVECVSKGGNLILNVGPDATGRFPAQSCRLLDEIGAWMALNGESIYGCGSAELPKPDWGWYTRRAGKLYAHVLEAPLGPLPLTGLVPAHIGAVRRLADGGEVVRGESWVTSAYENLAFVSFGTVPQYTYPLPDTIDTVLEIEYQ